MCQTFSAACDALINCILFRNLFVVQRIVTLKDSLPWIKYTEMWSKKDIKTALNEGVINIVTVTS